MLSIKKVKYFIFKTRAIIIYAENIQAKWI